MKFATKAIHAGQEPDPRTGAVNVPVYLSTTFLQDGIGAPRQGYEYARTANPSRDALEATLAALENGTHAACFASGLAATDAVLRLVDPGDEVVTTLDVYGGTYRQFARVFARYGVRFTFVPGASAEEILRHAGPATKLIWLETPTNPLLKLTDIAVVAAGKPKGARLVVDNTFATPYFQNPLDLGADLVVHSVTKYLGGHSDVVGGAVITREDALAERVRFHQNAVGAVPSPFDCFLVQRGLKTLAVRMERHAANAIRVAEFLRTHTRVAEVRFPWFEDHPDAALARRQMRGPSGMVSLRLAGGRAAIEDFVGRLALFAYAESLGGVESLACYPVAMTHGSIPEADRARIGLTDDLVRLSVGLEDADDLVAELERALG